MNSQIISYAIMAHHETNHLYDGKPYSVHLSLVVHYAQKYLHLIPTEYHEDILSACWLHDTIEDARKTYNDIKKISNERVANIVYALTNEKGKTRHERANVKYYLGIVNEPFASFVKLCDRLANIKYGKDNNSRMFNVYLNEHEQFIDYLLVKNLSYYKPILDEMEYIINNDVDYGK